MKQLQRIFLTSVSSILLLTVAPSSMKAQALPQATEVGNLMGLHLCKSLIEQGNLESDESMLAFTAEMVTKYGETETLKIMEKIDLAFNSEKWTEDRYVLELMRGVFSYMINDDKCFEFFAKDAF
jgi:hypothetical protein